MATGRRIVDVGPREIAAGDERVAHGLEVVRAEVLHPAQRRNAGVGLGEVFHPDRIVVAVAVHRHRRRQRDCLDAADRLDAMRDLLVQARDLIPIGDERRWDREAQRQDGFRIPEPGRHVADRDERPHHQAGGHEQHRGQRDLRDDQRVARAMTLAAFARSARAVLQRRRHVRPRVLEDRNRAEQQAGDERDAEREEPARSDRA